MSEVRMLINAYLERLHERLEGAKSKCLAKIEDFLQQELANQDFGEALGGERYAAYLEAARSFVAERIETYNPIGMQYVYDGISGKEAIELDKQLNWYDSRAEYEDLKQTAREILANTPPRAAKLQEMAEELIVRCGAYPDRSIIEGYENGPALRKLPDYVVARAIEKILNTRKNKNAKIKKDESPSAKKHGGGYRGKSGDR